MLSSRLRKKSAGSEGDAGRVRKGTQGEFKGTRMAGWVQRVRAGQGGFRGDTQETLGGVYMGVCGGMVASARSLRRRGGNARRDAPSCDAISFLSVMGLQRTGA
eukprot:CAMPEP_0180004604 /NCGR_PEP_ID=MMETSP0984-20121128/12208_1 /TAXON_ID=483367 /ORGANISM="non described non described, Strain CCMP 2436" /LENGTH=103 /DNA_ID=CAMNT_0021925175 /DNA_START=1 /DNA_END=309 /DNA_ORIENTATION=-